MDIVQTIVSGLLVGGVLALLATGLALIFGVMKVVNFAQGDFVMLGMYGAFFVITGLQMPSLVVAVVLFPVFAALGVLTHVLLLSRLTGSSAAAKYGHEVQLLATLGLSLILQNLTLMVIGPDPKSLSLDATSAAWRVGGLVLNEAKTLGFLLAMVATAALAWFLNRTRQGRRLRAAADDPVAAGYVGVDVGRAHRLAMAIGVGLAGVGGGILGTYYAIQPFVAWDWIVLMFAAVVLGGLGSVSGAFLGGLVIGVVQAVSQTVLPLQLQYVGVFAVFLLVLYVRPQGMFGKAVRI